MLLNDWQVESEELGGTRVWCVCHYIGGEEGDIVLGSFDTFYQAAAQCAKFNADPSTLTWSTAEGCSRYEIVGGAYGR